RDSSMAKRFELLAEGVQGVAIAGGRRVGRNAEDLADLLEREFLPDLECEHFALFDRQALERGFNFLATLVTLARKFLEIGFTFFEPTFGFLFASGAAVVTSGKIERGPPNRSDEKRLWIARKLALMPPVPDEGVLDDILRVGHRTGPLAGAKE
ncbi:MAG TPA: hypothetical protein VFJ90_14765, partial [Candidatus Didemnitutus sp.]|nr:hypothetical protein [Candidatus Didemnitutus sp.]